MSKGFFPSSLFVKKAPESLIPKCGACGLADAGCVSPKMPVGGKGKAGIMIVGDAPGKYDDEEGIQFAGAAGERLQFTLEANGVDIREDCWTTNALICRPPRSKIADSNWVGYCRPNLLRTMRELQPRVTILLGYHAVKSLVQETWGKEDVGDIARWVGWNIPSHRMNTWICPTYHPSYVIDKEEDENRSFKFFDRHIEAALQYTSRPWVNGPPDWESKVRVIFDTDEAARIVDAWAALGGTFAFDYENTCLKPEYVGGEIVCASLCREGKETISFPWHGKVIEAVRRIVHSEHCSFIASNMKHEDRWTRWAFGRPVRNWAWDTMIAAHAIDNREYITGLKFQSYVYLGMPSYNDHIEQFLRPPGSGKINRVKSEVDLGQLLRYCGVDTLLEYKLAVIQCQILADMKPTIYYDEDSARR